MGTAPLSKQQERLLASYLAGENVDDALLDECKRSPKVLKELSDLIANQRMLNGELDPLNDKILFAKEVIARLDKSNQRASLGETLQVELPDKVRFKARYERRFTRVASIALFLCIVVLFSINNSQHHLATVTKLAATSHLSDSLGLGSKIGKGDVFLNKGYSELTLSNGVILVLEAPVSLRLRSSEQVIVNSGKIVAKVPPEAIGFRIDTPSAEIIDLGTEFGVAVAENGESQVHVLDGEIKARANELNSFKVLKKDEALSFDKHSNTLEMPSQPKRFMRVLPGHSAEKPNFLHWSFDDIAKNKQFNSSGKGFDGEQYPAVDRSQKDDSIKLSIGKFGQAVDFNGNGNWLETSFPGIGNDHPRTVSFWVKVPRDFSINNAYGILSWGVQQDYASWQISPNPETSNGELGRLRIGTYNAQVVGSTDLRDDRWHHVAVVMYGGETADISTHVLLYVDGELEKTENKSIAKINTLLDHPKSKPLSLGRNIGFHPEAEHETQNYFKGSVDELFIFEAALSQKQIRTLMQNNRL
ncbi:LamG-like jellyroll fold domain-containing protein [Agaribacter flavus]|uniref:LamG-like jellyroll fold domain-containing protein n=1 Tax=Agaribacter flavus TaxID=1902781 RepID=A0ABV7FQA3_9ALTE